MSSIVMSTGLLKWLPRVHEILFTAFDCIYGILDQPTSKTSACQSLTLQVGLMCIWPNAMTCWSLV